MYLSLSVINTVTRFPFTIKHAHIYVTPHFLEKKNLDRRRKLYIVASAPEREENDCKSHAIWFYGNRYFLNVGGYESASQSMRMRICITTIAFIRLSNLSKRVPPISYVPHHSITRHLLWQERSHKISIRINIIAENPFVLPFSFQCDRWYAPIHTLICVLMSTLISNGHLRTHSAIEKETKGRQTRCCCSSHLAFYLYGDPRTIDSSHNCRRQRTDEVTLYRIRGLQGEKISLFPTQSTNFPWP